MLQAQTIMRAHILLHSRCHLRAGFRHARHLVRGGGRIQIPRAGVSHRCQLNCQEGYDEEAGYPKPALE
jgi:hypothetical protein